MPAALCLGTVAGPLKTIGGLPVTGRQAYGNSGNQAKSIMIAIRNEALPHGKNRKTTKSALAATEATASGRQLAIPPHREGHRQRCEHAHRNDQQKRDSVHPAVPRVGITAAHHRHINSKRGQHQRRPKRSKQHNRETTRPPVRQLITQGYGENQNQRAGDKEGRNLYPTVGSTCQ
jgi:hypothetical protein